MKRLTLILILTICSQVAPGRAADGILPIERLIVDSPVECGAAWDGTGQLIYSACGPFSDRVIIPDEIMITVVGSGTVTHNHPEPGCWTFSPGDLIFAASAYLQEFRVVAYRNGVVTVSILRRVANIWKMPDGEIEAEERRQRQSGCDYLATAWSNLAARYGFEYTVIHD